MKQLNVYFEDEEYKKIFSVKKELGLSWHDFIYLLSKKEVKEVVKN